MTYTELQLYIDGEWQNGAGRKGLRGATPLSPGRRFR